MGHKERSCTHRAFSMVEEIVSEQLSNEYSITNCNKCYKGKVGGTNKENMECEG